LHEFLKEFTAENSENLKHLQKASKYDILSLDFDLIQKKGFVMNKGIALAGNLIVDKINLLDSSLSEGELSNIKETLVSIGGCAGNTAADLAKIDPSINIAVIGRVGDDPNGEYIKTALSELGVDVEGIVTSSEKSTSFTEVMSDMTESERTFLKSNGANAEFSIDDIDFSNLNVDIFHIGYTLSLDKFDAEDAEYTTVMAKTLAKVSELGIKTAMDIVNEDTPRFVEVITPSLKYCDYLIINEVEASLITGIPVRDEEGNISQNAIKTVISALFEMGVREVISIHSKEGGWYSQKGSGIYYQPSLNLPQDMIKGRVGAGDAYCAGMLYSLYSEFDPEYSLRVSLSAAGCCLTEINSIDGLRVFDKMMEFESEIGYPEE